MLPGGKVNTILPFLADDHQYQYQSNASNQLQLFGNVQSPCGVNPVWMNKLDSQVGKIREHQQLQISLNHSNFCNEYDLTAAIHPPDLVSTGLRLSYDEDEHNSSLSSAGGSMSTNPSIFLSLDKNTGTELDHQNEEFDQYVKVQVEHLTKGIKEMQERHLVSLLSAMERGVIKKLLEKDMEIENINRRNRELGERIKQATIEVQSWQYRAKYNESVANVLKTKLQQVISVGAGEGKEGFGDSELDDAASYIDLKNRHERPRGLVCKACNLGEARVLLIPCRHLCICKACSGLVTVCPVCRLTVTDRLDVYMS